MHPILRHPIVALASLLSVAGAPLRAASAASVPDEAVKLAPFEIAAEKDSGYKVSSATTASRMNTPVIDIPQTVDIVTSEFWSDRGATTFDESFKYVSNIYVRNRHANGGNQVNLRGFQTSSSIMIDGIRLTTNFKHNLVGYDRLEIMKGPASAVQGRAGGSGVLNYILKKPELGKNRTWVKYTTGTDDFNGAYNRGDFDTNVAVGDGKTFAARVAGALQKSDDYLKFQETSLGAVYPSFRWKISSQSEVVLTNELLKQRTPSREEGHGFQLHPYKLRILIPMFNTPTDAITSLHLPENFNPAGPGNDERTRVMASTLSFTHTFNSNLSFRQTAHWRYVADDIQNYNAATNTTPRVAQRLAEAKSWGHNFTVQGDLIGTYKAPYFSGHTLMGYNYGRTTGVDQAFQGDLNAPFNFVNLTQLAASGNSEKDFAGRQVIAYRITQASTSKATNFSAYANQGFDFFDKRLKVTGGLRRENDVTSGRNTLTGAPTNSNDTWLNSWLYGATYKLSPKLSLYAVESRQFDASSTRAAYSGLPAGDPRNNEFLTVQPLTRLQELGLKGELFGGRMTGSVALWKMSREGGTQTLTHLTDSKATDFSRVIEVKGAESKGYEISLYGEVTQSLGIVANYMRMTTTQQDTFNNTLNPIPGLFAPTWALNVWAKYGFTQAPLRGWSLKGGVSYIGPLYTTLTGFTGEYRIPRRQKSIDLGFAYRWRRYDFDFMVNNLDKDPFLVTRDQPSRNYRLSVATQF